MTGILWVMSLSLLMQGCLCSPGQTDTGCMRWTPPLADGKNVCCEECHPGNRLVSLCGQNPKELCKPCEPGTFTMNPKADSCERCTQCVGAQVHLKNCTTTSDTKCGCKEGLICGDVMCSFCVDKCDKGQEPTADRSCRPCPAGTFNDKSHHKCKPWSTKCPSPDQVIVTKGDAVTDIVCASVSVPTEPSVKPLDPTEQAWAVVLSVVTSVVVIAFGTAVFIIIIVTVKIQKKRRKPKKTSTKTPIITTPTDNPRTLIAIECSFHEAQQEQGSSSESLDSKDSSEQLIA